MTENEGAAIATILEDLARRIETAPVMIVGISVQVESGSGGSVTGLEVRAKGGPPGTHSVGLRASVNSDTSRYQADMGELVREIREAANEARASSEKPAQSWVKSLLNRGAKLGNRALDPIIEGATGALIKFYAGI